MPVAAATLKSSSLQESPKVATCLGLKLVSIGFKTLKDLLHCSYNELFVVELYVKHNQRGTFYGTT